MSAENLKQSLPEIPQEWRVYYQDKFSKEKFFLNADIWKKALQVYSNLYKNYCEGEVMYLPSKERINVSTQIKMFVSRFRGLLSDLSFGISYILNPENEFNLRLKTETVEEQCSFRPKQRFSSGEIIKLFQEAEEVVFGEKLDQVWSHLYSDEFLAILLHHLSHIKKYYFPLYEHAPTFKENQEKILDYLLELFEYLYLHIFLHKLDLTPMELEIREDFRKKMQEVRAKITPQ